MSDIWTKITLEGGNLSEFTGSDTSGVSSAIAADATSALTGSFGLHSTKPTGANNGYARAYKDFSVPGNNYVSIRFQLKVVSMSAGSGGMLVATLMENSSIFHELTSLFYDDSAAAGSKWQMEVYNRDTTSTYTPLSTQLSTGTIYRVEIIRDCSGANPVNKIYLDDIQVATYTDSTTGTIYKPNRARFGLRETFWTVTGEAYYDEIQGADALQANPPTLDQEGARFRNDDGSETTATWAANQDTDLTAPLGTNLRLRMLINAANDPLSKIFRLDYKKNGTGSYIAVPTSATYITTPVIEAADATESGSDTAANPWSVNTPAASTGDLLIFCLSWDDSTTTTGVTAPSGPNGETLTAINSTPATDASTETRSKVWYTIATGTWTAGTLSFTPSASEQRTASVIRIPAGEFDGSTPIGASSTRGATGTAETAILMPAFTAGASDGNGRLCVWTSADTDPQTVAANFTQVSNTDRGAVSGGFFIRDAAVTNSESITGVTVATIASDSWSTVAFVVRAPAATNNQIYVAASGNITAGGEATTAQLTAPSGKSTSDFTTGRMWDDENGTDSIDIANNFYTELEWCLKTQSPSVNTDYYEFRVTVAGTVLDTYTVTPKWTIGTNSNPIYGQTSSNAWGTASVSSKGKGFGLTSTQSFELSSVKGKSVIQGTDANGSSELGSIRGRLPILFAQDFGASAETGNSSAKAAGKGISSGESSSTAGPSAKANSVGIDSSLSREVGKILGHLYLAETDAAESIGIGSIVSKGKAFAAVFGEAFARANSSGSAKLKAFDSAISSALSNTSGLGSLFGNLVGASSEWANLSSASLGTSPVYGQGLGYGFAFGNLTALGILQAVTDSISYANGFLSSTALGPLYGKLFGTSIGNGALLGKAFAKGILPASSIEFALPSARTSLYAMALGNSSEFSRIFGKLPGSGFSDSYSFETVQISGQSFLKVRDFGTGSAILHLLGFGHIPGNAYSSSVGYLRYFRTENNLIADIEVQSPEAELTDVSAFAEISQALAWATLVENNPVCYITFYAEPARLIAILTNDPILARIEQAEPYGEVDPDAPVGRVNLQ